eukprot:1188253-Prorocentrum_minimum.AAC.3
MCSVVTKAESTVGQPCGSLSTLDREYVEYSAEYSKCRALNGILVYHPRRRPFWPPTPPLASSPEQRPTNMHFVRLHTRSHSVDGTAVQVR